MGALSRQTSQIEQAETRFIESTNTGGSSQALSSANVKSDRNQTKGPEISKDQSSANDSVFSSGLKAIGAAGANASTLLHSRAKSLMDLPNFLSSTIGLPAFSAASPSEQGSVSSRPAENPSSKLKPSDKLAGIHSKQFSTGSLFEGLDGESLPECFDLNILDEYLEKIAVEKSAGKFLIPKYTLILLKTVRFVFAIRQCFSKILACEPQERFHQTLFTALDVLLSHIQLNIRKYQTGSPSILRVFLIILENPFLRDIDQSDGTLLKICGLVSSLKSRSRQLLVKWLSIYSSDEFLRLLSPYQEYFNKHVSSSHRPNDTVISVIKTISLINSSNSLHPQPIVPISVFYNNALAKKLNFKEEYKIWMRGHTGVKEKLPASPSQYQSFSYFNFPFLFDPVSKNRIIHIDAMAQMSLQYEEAVVHQAIVIHAQRFLHNDSETVKDLEEGLKRETNPYLVLEIRRQFLVKDVLDQIHKKTDSDLKKPVKVKFVGGGEEGMDQGGVQKEFFQVLMAMLMDPAFGMFVYDPETRFSWLNGASLEPERQFELVGIIIGLALYNGVMLGIGLVPVLYKKLLGEQISFEDLMTGFPSLGKGLKMLLDWDEKDGDVEDIFCRSFEISYDVYGQVKTIPLIDGGESVSVNNKNRKEYVSLYVEHYLEESVKRQFSALKHGFYRMCRAEELEMLICGTSQLDFQDLEAGAKYDDGYSSDHPLIRHFWGIVHSFSLERKKKLLMFVTASDRVPLKGLGNLVFVIQRNGPDTNRLPTALTCFGRLLLPEYSSKERLENRLVTAIENAKGFGLV
ncbi:hypothetical protein HDU84_009326 [Entophlyctis sp. JEL0112]|nr:hypothetical protein HDU84_009326 [Entophlyctis sp. JEL0112]